MPEDTIVRSIRYAHWVQKLLLASDIVGVSNHVLESFIADRESRKEVLRHEADTEGITNAG